MRKQIGIKKNLDKVISVILTVLVSSAVIISASYAFRGYLNRINLDLGNEELIGGARDNGGCLVAAGYSWCEAKQKCLRVWEEACTDKDIPEQTKILAEDYFRSHISELAPEKEVLGGKFYITNVKFTSRTRAVVDYEDGHNAYRAAAVFTIGENSEVNIEKFSLISKNGSSPELAGNSNFAVQDLVSLFAQKYNKTAEEIEVKIRQQIVGQNGIQEYLRGSVFFGSGGAGEGGIFLAVMEDGEYKLVFGGNGGISCQLVESYGFPAEMVDDCYR